MRRFTPLTLFTLLLILAACSPAPATPELPDLEPGVWTMFEGGEDTACADGSDYTYYAYPGTANKVVIDFEGGGACWDGATCSSPNSNPNPTIGRSFYKDKADRAVLNAKRGIYDREKAENPLKDWYHVFVPYCTGDLHIGGGEQTYTNPFDSTEFAIQHKGAANAQAVLNWTFASFKAPESVFVTGCSAGAYGAAFWTDAIAEQYPDAEIYQLGDCGAGVSTDAFSAELAQSWMTDVTFPGTTFDANFTPAAYISTLSGSGELKMAQYNSLFDNVQIGFYAFGTGREPAEVGAEWSGRMLGSLQSVAGTSENFTSYTSLADDNANFADGTLHCILPRDDFYTLETDGVSFRDWLDGYVSGEEVGSVTATLGAPPSE